MRDFPIHTALAIVTLGLLLAGTRLVSPRFKGLDLAQFAAVVKFDPTPVPLSPLSRSGEPVLSTSAVRIAAPTILLDDSKGALDHFYQALWRSERREQGAVTRIMHYGDSPTTGDLITGDVRSILQSRFGNAGDGFVLMEKPWAWYQHRGVDLFALGWLIVPAGHVGAQDGMFGLGGVSFTGSTSARSRIVFRHARYSQFEVSFLRQPGGGRFTVSANGQELGNEDTSGDSKSPGFAAFRATPPAGDLLVEVDQGSVRLFGVTAENPGPGVVYDTLGLNGASITVLARIFNQDHWAEELRRRRPDLLIVNYGTNEAGFANFIETEYEKELREAIRRIHGALPTSSVLVMSPMDRGWRTPAGEIETMATIPRIVNIQRRVAGETGCGFFDTFDAMGGEGTMARWYSAEPRLVAADLIHPHGNGGKMIASFFTKEILAGLARFKFQQGRQNLEAAMSTPPVSKQPDTTPTDSAALDILATPPPAPAPHAAAAARAPAQEGWAHQEGRAPTDTRNQSHLHGQGAMIVLAEERSVSEELLEHPESLRQLIQSGLLFTVPNGTPVEIAERQGDWTKVVITEGLMRGRSGWIASKRVLSSDRGNR